MIEIEQRYKVVDVPATLTLLIASGLHQMHEKHIIDEWFVPLEVQTQEREHQWFDEEHGVAYRIRRVEQSDGSFDVKVETKQLTEENNHNTFAETQLAINDYNEAQEFLKKEKRWNWLTIDKTRRVFESDDPELEIVLDEIEGLAEKIGVGAAVEIEYKGNASREEALRKINNFAAQIGLSSSDLFNKSLAVEAMVVLAKFKQA